MTSPNLKAKRRVAKRAFYRRNEKVFDILAGEAERQGLDHVPLSGTGHVKLGKDGEVIEEQIIFDKET